MGAELVLHVGQGGGGLGGVVTGAGVIDDGMVPARVGALVVGEPSPVSASGLLMAGSGNARAKFLICQAVVAARQSEKSWSEIGAMLGVSKQAAQRKYGRAISAA